MNLVIKLFVIICSIFICISNVNSAETPHHCCSNNVKLATSGKCRDNSALSITCDNGSPILLDPSISSYYKFSIATDPENDNKAYLDAFIAEYHIYQPYFCTGEILYAFSNGSSPTVAYACSSERIWYKDINITSAESVQKAKFYRVYAFLSFVFNLTSALLLLTTAAIYFALPNLRDTQGTCYFFFSLVAGLGHSSLTYMEIFNSQGILPDMCITNAYLVVYCILCAISWSTLTCYNIWRTSMNYKCDDEAKLSRHYKIFGFGLPFCILFCAWAYAHINHIADLTLNLECIDHQQNLYGYFLAVPLLIMMFLNLIMFIHSQIRIWSLHTIQSQDRKLTIKILKYRLFMNAKLFFIMGVPWILLMLIYVIESTIAIGDDAVMSFIQFTVGLLVFGEGIPFFVILVLFRKRVLRGIGNKWFANSSFYPDKWKTMRGSETDEEVSDDESESPPKTPEAKFTTKIEEEQINGFDDSTIVIL